MRYQTLPALLTLCIISLLLGFSILTLYTYITMAAPTSQETSKSTPEEKAKDGPQKIIKKYLYARNWEKVIDILKENTDLYVTKINKSLETVLHVVVTHGEGDTLVKILDTMEETDKFATKNALKAVNKQGNTPLHIAAVSSSSLTKCERIVRIDKNLVSERNNNRETPLFLAALYGQKHTFVYLHFVSKNVLQPKDISSSLRRKGGETILHCTIQREHFDLAFLIIHLYKDQLIVENVDEKGITPLHVIASKPSAFKSGTRLRWWTRILYDCVAVEQLKVSVEQLKVSEQPQKKLPKNYQTCYDFFWFLWGLVKSVKWEKGIGRILEREAGQDSSRYENSYFPLNYATSLECLKHFYIYIFGVLGVITDIKKAKQKHVWCEQIMNELVDQKAKNEWPDGGSDPLMDPPTEETESFINFINKQKNDSSPPNLTNVNAAQQNQQEKKEAQPKEIDQRLEALLNKLLKLNEEPQPETMTTLLVAAKNGVIEMVQKILADIPEKIHDRTKEEKTILHVAVENRQPHIFAELMNNNFWNNLKETVDIKGNNVLHLAAKVSKYKPWKIPGAAMQMQWEIKWYQYVKNSVPDHLIYQANQEDDTPEEVFHESHKGLVQEGSEWLKSTSESCSVVAALIAGVSFATSSQLPGGNDDQTGKPTLEGHPAFDLFAMTSLVALCFSITALVMFLAILTSRKQPKDFRRSLPLKLLIGLTSLFLSIASILVSFCAAYFFVLKDKLSTGLYLIYTATCLPVSFYAVAQFPLYFDLFKAIIRKLPQPSYKGDDL